jgi:hypothetical protein
VHENDAGSLWFRTAAQNDCLRDACAIYAGFARLESLPSRVHTMLNAKLIDDITAKISEIIAASPARDIEKNLRALMTAAFAKMDLVTREEFDVQVELLKRTREKLEDLERRAGEIEQRNQGGG